MLRCPRCHAEFELADQHITVCPACGANLPQADGATIVGTFPDDDPIASTDGFALPTDEPKSSTETVSRSVDIESFKVAPAALEQTVVPTPATDQGTIIGEAAAGQQPAITGTPVAGPQPTFIGTPAAGLRPTVIGESPGAVDPALLATGIGQFAKEWSDAASVAGASANSSLKFGLPRGTEGESTLRIELRRVRTKPESDGTAADYDLLNLLGKGGMGVVYAARQASIDRTVAVKMLKSETVDSADARSRFLSEACVTGDLEHPNIVPIYDVGRDDSGALFYAMKRVQGTPWKDVIHDKTVDQNLQILMRVADAVAFAHSKGILHRDLKPENIMLGEFGEVLVMDWGLAMPTDPDRRFGGIRQLPDIGGTPAYMAPEMVVGPLPSIGMHSDVYLFGAILYEIVTGLRPHKGTDAMGCLQAVARNVIQPTEKSGELVNIALKAMATRSEDRHASVSEFQQAVSDYQSHSESLLLSDRAAEHLTEARQSCEYEDFNRALFGFQQAIELWDGNESAARELSTTRLDYARTAQQKGDFDLAAGLLDLSIPDHDVAHREITEAAHERELRQQRARTYRRLGIALAVLLFAVVTGAAIWINNERNFAMEQKEEAENNWQLAEARKELVEVERDNVETQRQQAVANADEAMRQKGIAEDNMQLAQRKEQEARTERERAEENERKAIAARRAEAYEAYVARIAAAAARIDENAHDQARELLEKCIPPTLADGTVDPTATEDHRNWEWDRLWYLCQQASRRFDVGMAAECLAVRFSTDGGLDRFAVGGANGELRIHDADGVVITNIATQASVVHSAIFSPDGSRLAVGSDAANPLQVFDVQTGKSIFNDHPFALAAVFSVQYSNDGQLLLTGADDGTATVFDAANGSILTVLHGHRRAVSQAIFAVSADASRSTRIVTVSHDGTAIVWTDSTGRWTDEVSIEQSSPFAEHQGPIFAVSASPDGTTIASAGHDHRVLLWHPTDLKDFDFAAAVTQVTPADFHSPYDALDGHSATIRSLQFSAGGNVLISAGHDNSIRVWDVARRTTVKTLRGHGQWICGVQFDPDCETVISASYDNSVRTWDLAGYQEVRVLRARTLAGHDDAVLDAQFSGTSDRIVTASRDRTLRTWRTANGKQIHKFREGHAFLASLAVVSPDGSTLATAAVDGTVRLWHVVSGSQRHVLTDTGRGAVAAFSPDGKLLATGGPQQKSIDDQTANWTARIWDTQTGKLVRDLTGHDGQVSAVAFSPDGSTLYCGDVTGLGTLWHVATGERQRKLKWHSARVIFARFADNGTLITAAVERAVVKWNSSTGTVDESNILLHDSQLTTVDVDADGRFVVTACDDNSVRLWDWTTGKVQRVLQAAEANPTDAAARICTVRICPDKRSVALADSDHHTVRLFDFASGRESLFPQNDGRKGPFLTFPLREALQSIAYTLDGHGLFTVGGDQVRRWEIDNQRLPFRRLAASYSPHGIVVTAAFSPDQRSVLSGSQDGTAVIWNATSGESLRKLTGAHSGMINSAIYGPQSAPQLALTTSDDTTAVLWNASTGQFLRRYTGHTGPVVWGEFSHDGQRIVTASTDGTARIWNVNGNGNPIHVLGDHTGTVVRAAFSPDDTLLATAGADNTATIRNAATGKLLLRLKGHTASVNAVVFTPDNERLITASDDFHCKVWDTATGKELLTLKGHTRELNSVAFSADTNSLLTASTDGTAILWLARSH